MTRFVGSTKDADALKGSFECVSADSCTGGSTSSKDQAFIQQTQELSCQRRTQNNDAGPSARQRRVCFIDEVGLTPRRELVTSVIFRPPTTVSENLLLYYTAYDYGLFALEEHKSKINDKVESHAEGLSWEDCMVYDGDYGHGTWDS
mmetsp:Transcript_22526/g.38610  ORF Transcript_22526/g.38610 Transcript_22526/m.38610 type:complete len:147 (+) Transcript_22526:150-590(+)|eukprot:CAMPEP_0183734640 /NCGR_PEP_ID=MMETSP0737-20130205/44377_1 /TAXON_ID=385413 /ORGANISM="Thalassiosira miniscula, Strain CCMP1093" /LENGTH=146 /DNA_ID=CAMNT_0025968177 /DNA_START=213 /DNA_END=653 /DNA_ORIENTATION=+